MSPDRFDLMAAMLAGERLPPLPEVPGRVFRLPEPTTPEQDAAALDAEAKATAIWRQLAEGEGSGDHD